MNLSCWWWGHDWNIIRKGWFMSGEYNKEMYAGVGQCCKCGEERFLRWFNEVSEENIKKELEK